MLERPEVVAVSCDECSTYTHDENWKPVYRGGRKIPLLQPPPCFTCPKVPQEAKDDARAKGRKVTRADASEWNNDSYQAWHHYWATKAGTMPQQDAASQEMCGMLEQAIHMNGRRTADPMRLGSFLARLIGKR